MKKNLVKQIFVFNFVAQTKRKNINYLTLVKMTTNELLEKSFEFAELAIQELALAANAINANSGYADQNLYRICDKAILQSEYYFKLSHNVKLLYCETKQYNKRFTNKRYIKVN